MFQFTIPKSMALQFAASMLEAGLYAVLSWTSDDFFNGEQINGIIASTTDAEKLDHFKKQYSKFIKN